MFAYYTSGSHKLRKSYSQNKTKQTNKEDQDNLMCYRNTSSGILYAKNIVSGVRGLERFQICNIGIGAYRFVTQIDFKNAYSLIRGRWF